MNKISIILSVLGLVAVSFALGPNRVAWTTRTQTPANSGWSILQRAPANEDVTFTITLPRKNLDILEQFWWDVSNPDHEKYGKFMTREQVIELIAPEASIPKRVMKWIYSNAENQKDVKIDNQRDALKVTCPVKLAEALFETELWIFVNDRNNMGVIKHLGTISFPNEVAGDIVYLSGITELPVVPENSRKMKRMAERKAQRQALDNECNTPYTMASLYGVPENATVTNLKSNVSIYALNYVGEGQGFGVSDIQAWEAANNIPNKPIKCLLGNALSQYGPEGTDLEAMLDTQLVTGIAVGANVCWYLMSLEDGWMYEFARYVFTVPDAPLIISISYGWNENMQCDNASEGIEGLGNCTAYNIPNSFMYTNMTNTEFIKLGAVGHSIIVASGDDGSVGGHGSLDNCETVASMFPAASPYVTTCGATSIEPSTNATQRVKYDASSIPPICTNAEYQCECSTSTNEQVASINNTAEFCSGGGFSDYFARPSYQDNAVTSYLKSGVKLPDTSYGWNPANRGYPDIAAVGENICVMTGDSTSASCEMVGGTSAAAPHISALVTILNSDRITAGKSPLGPLNQLIYKMFDTDKTKYFNNNFLADNNSGECPSALGYNSMPGYWSPMTGCGSPKFSAIRQYVATLK